MNKKTQIDDLKQRVRQLEKELANLYQHVYGYQAHPNPFLPLDLTCPPFTRAPH